MCVSKEVGFIMGTMDAIIGIIIIGVFFFIIGSKVYQHEKEHLDPMIEKVKGWFHKKEDISEEDFSEGGDYELDFLGKVK